MEKIRNRAIIFFLIALSYWIIVSFVRFFPPSIYLALALVSAVFAALLFITGIKLIKKKDTLFGAVSVLIAAILFLAGLISLILEFLIEFL